jgi:hypothetical protein
MAGICVEMMATPCIMRETALMAPPYYLMYINKKRSLKLRLALTDFARKY